MTPDRSPTRTPSRTSSMSRRRCLAVGTAVGTSLVAGCSTAVDFLAGMVLEDVNVLNGTETALAGSIAVTDAEGSVVLDDRFDLAAGGDDADEDAQATYDDAVTEAGEYTVAIELDDEDAVGGDHVLEDTVEVADPDEEHVIVFFGSAETDAAVVTTVIEDLSDLEAYAEFDDEF
ncbi:hypothetical protein [Natronococcus occultus]|uniref:Uncharacterized protein n=1 Tax=Natronococcus occultus SP4 TaxID=694430 RepID=L0K2X9_9EURY|nr:hypothetical protein [Natronococcus occultus]AGB38714.1 hypothetical protein Natoc_2959 [Natronococcus occultus SP4]